MSSWSNLIYNPADMTPLKYSYGSLKTTTCEVSDAATRLINADIIIKHVKLLHCNIVNYMPLYIARIVIHKNYDIDTVNNHIKGVKVIYESELYDMNNLPQYIEDKLNEHITYALATAKFPTDKLEDYINLTENRGV